MHSILQSLAASAGIDAIGITPLLHADLTPDFPELNHLEPWVAQGHAGDMDYLKRRTPSGRLQRERIQSSLPWARSVIVCALNYNGPQPLSTDPAPLDTGWIARYAQSGSSQSDTSYADQHTDINSATDYHQVLHTKLRLIESALRDQFPHIEARSYVDTGPLVERVYAQHAGIGWVGKNTCLIRQGLGSWFFLGVIITSLDLGSDALRNQADQRLSTAQIAAPDRCGSCTRCIDACPTAAIVAPHQLDASHCIAYLTIEKRGPIPEEFRSAIGRNLFGCDICQDVCPWNRKAPISTDAQMQPRPQLVSPALDWLASLSHADFRRLFRGSPVERKRYKGMAYKAMRRNLAIAMGNSGQTKFLPQLNLWTESPDPALAESARWALQKINTSDSVTSQHG